MVCCYNQAFCEWNLKIYNFSVFASSWPLDLVFILLFELISGLECKRVLWELSVK